MRSTVFAAAAVGNLVALVGSAGTANASATIDLIWAEDLVPQADAYEAENFPRLHIVDEDPGKKTG